MTKCYLRVVECVDDDDDNDNDNDNIKVKIRSTLMNLVPW